jgi:hypothetical protein
MAFPQDINQKVRSAVDTLSTGRNSAIEVSIEPVTVDGTGTPTAFSRYLAGKLELYAVNNTLFKVVQLHPPLLVYTKLSANYKSYRQFP